MRKLLPLAVALTMAVCLGAQTTKCTFTSDGAGCGPKLSGSEKLANGLVIATFKVTKAPATAHGLIAFGVKSANIKLPGNCVIHLEPLVVVVMNSDSRGKASRTFVRPQHTPLKLTLLCQTAFADPRHNQALEVSNALKIECK